LRGLILLAGQRARNTDITALRAVDFSAMQKTENYNI
jgi:hypothetical protein